MNSPPEEPRVPDLDAGLDVEGLEKRVRALGAVINAIDSGTLEATSQQRAYLAGATRALEGLLPPATST
jgi:hypothetical protein